MLVIIRALLSPSLVNPPQAKQVSNLRGTNSQTRAAKQAGKGKIIGNDF